jgi:RNA-binding protein PNO1
MASLQSLKAPTLMSKKTQKKVQADEDDVIIDATALPSRTVQEDDVTMEEGSTSTDKPNFAPASSAELKVNQEPQL